MKTFWLGFYTSSDPLESFDWVYDHIYGQFASNQIDKGTNSSSSQYLPRKRQINQMEELLNAYDWYPAIYSSMIRELSRH